MLIALLPAAAAVMAIIRGRERPPLAFWILTGLGALTAVGFGFFAWYRGLAIGPITRVSQVQLAQPVLSLIWVGLLVRESITWTTIAGELAVILCAGASVRARSGIPVLR